MKEDTNPIRTEDLIKDLSEEYDSRDSNFIEMKKRIQEYPKLKEKTQLHAEIIKGILEEYEEMLKKFIQVLGSVENDYNREEVVEYQEQYREKIPYRLSEKTESVILETEKLKAENEELKKHLPDMTKWTIGLIIKELEEHPEYTASEILKRHKELYFGSPTSKYLEELEESNKAHIEACGQWNEKYYKLTLEYDKTQQENNQLKHDLSDVIYRYENNTEIADLRLISDMLGCGKNHVVLEVQKLKQLKQRITERCKQLKKIIDENTPVNSRCGGIESEIEEYSYLQQLLKDDTK